MSSRTLYLKSGCSTCISARRWLTEAHVPFAERDMFRHPLSDDELETLVSRVSAASLFSFRSPSVKSLGLNPDAMAEAEMLHWMGREPRLIRRPLLVTPERIVIGFDPEALRAALDAGA